MSASTLIPDNLLTLPTEEFKKQFREYQKQFRKRFGVPRPRKNRPSRLKCPHLSHPAPIYGPEVDPYIAGAAEARTMPISAQSQDGLSDREALKLYPGFIGPVIFRPGGKWLARGARVNGSGAPSMRGKFRVVSQRQKTKGNGGIARKTWRKSFRQ